MRIGFAFDVITDRSVEGQEEFDSPETVAAIGDAIRQNGHEVIALGDGREFVEKLLAHPVDLVFNIAEGHGESRSREARVPAVCEMLGVPYVGSDPLTMCVTLDKDVARRLVASTGIPLPAGGLVEPGQSLPQVPYPAFIKPAWEGSSKGISQRCIVSNADEARERLREFAKQYRQPMLIEEYIEGHEITAGVLGPNHEPEVLGVMRILPRKPTERFIYEYSVKSDCHKHLIYESPAHLPAATIGEIKRCSAIAYRALGCRDFARVDFRVRNGVPYFLEANPLPGLSPITGDIVMIGDGVGVGHVELIGRIIDSAIRRLKL
jgi:D-alanine-D-alanine ligase